MSTGRQGITVLDRTYYGKLSIALLALRLIPEI